MRTLPLAFVIASASCVSVGSFEPPTPPSSTPPPDPVVDLDGDGFAGIDDCDETDAGVNAFALDVLDDGIDQDCTGSDANGPRGPTIALATDALATWTGVERGREGGVGTAVAAADLDGDGAVELVLTTGEARYPDGVYRGRVAIHPLVAGSWGPGQATTTLLVPSDFGHRGTTSWVQADSSGDGVSDLWMRGALGDTHASMLVGSFPAGEHVSGDVASAIAPEELGWAPGPCGDLDGDGSPEVLLASGDVVRAYATPLPADLADAVPAFEWDLDGTTVRRADARFDLTGDGWPDLVVNGTHVFERHPAQSAGAALPIATLTSGPDMSLGLSWLIADLDADGQMDLATLESGLPGRGVRVHLGPLFGALGPDDVDAVIRSDRRYGDLGQALAAGDIDGDGALDLVISEPWYWAWISDWRPGPGSAPGRVLVFRGPLAGAYAPGDASIAWEGEEPGAGYALASGFDADGDGRDDILVGAPLHGDDRQGRLYWVRGRDLP